MIYVDTSVALATLLAEDRRPADDFWDQALLASRLLEYELWVRINARGLSESHGELGQALLDRVSFLELHPRLLERALGPFPRPVRTLDALHLATLEYLRQRRVKTRLATYDDRMAQVASEMGVTVFAP